MIPNTLISTNRLLHFTVAEDVEFLARFSPAVRHPITFNAEAGGRIINSDGIYYVMDVIEIVAEADEGYRFVKWTATAGSFAAYYNETTRFAMPNTPVIITAYFEPIN